MSDVKANMGKNAAEKQARKLEREEMVTAEEEVVEQAPIEELVEEAVDPEPVVEEEDPDSE